MRKVVNIEWDLEDDDYLGLDAEDLNLPNEVEILDYLEEDEIADFLSDEYGFCVLSFDIEEEDDIEEEITCPYCYDTAVVESKNGLWRCLGCGNEF